MLKKTSIVIPTYNASSSICRAIRSCIKQTYPSIEILVINDGSTDRSAQLLQKEFGEIKNVIIKNKLNEGVGKARNDGIRLATGDYLYFLDADDYLEPDAIELMVNALEHDNGGIAISGYTVKSGNHFTNVSPKLLVNSIPLENFILDKIISSPWAKLFRADIVKKYNIVFSNHKIMQDGFFNVRYFCEVKKITIIGKPLYIYDKGLSTSTTSITEEKLRLIISAMREQKKIAVEHSGLPPETIENLFMVRSLRLAVLFPLQCGARDKLIREEAKLLVRQGLLTNKRASLHEKIQVIALLLHNKCYELTNSVLICIKRLVH